MTKWILTAFLLLSAPANAQDITVTELDLGACWVKGDGNGFWKIASFNDGAAFYMSEFRIGAEFEAAFEAEMRRLGFASYDKTPYEVYLHCSGGGHAILVNLGAGRPSVCVSTNHELKTVSVRPSYGGPRGVCQGVQERALLVVTRRSESPHELARQLRLPRYAPIVGSVDVLSGAGILKLNLTAKYRFRENEAKRQIETDLALAKFIQTVDYNRMDRIAGGSMLLFAGELNGFASAAEDHK